MKRPSTATSRQLDTIFDRLVYCPSCTTWRTTPLKTSRQIAATRSKRLQSTWTSSTAINGAHPIPPRFKPLHDALVEVRKKASIHVSLSRLQLALQSLESSQPTIRLAILGLNVPDTARRLARLLLADALEDEGKWEKQLAEGVQDFSRGLIIRYGQGDNPNIPRPKTSVPILYVPANVLQRNNVEILVSSVSGPGRSENLQSRVQTPSDTFLSPVVGTPTSESGRQVNISQPTHKSLVVVEGLDQLITAAELLSSTKFTSVEDRESVTIAVNLEKAIAINPDNKTLMVDVQKAEEGLAAIRKSVTLATDYEHKWIDGGMPTLSKWLKMSAATQDAESRTISPPVRDVVSSILTAAMSSIRDATIESSKETTSRGLSKATLTNLGEAIDQFSRSAHQELQAGLASAWRSRNWRKLSWYKLFWRVDDVGLIITDLVSNAWLPKTERAVYELSGRLVQVGITPVTKDTAPPPPVAGAAFELAPAQDTTVIQPDGQLATAVIEPQATQPVIVNQAGTSAVVIEPVAQPIPIASNISRARTAYISAAIASLTTTAQQLVLRTLSVAGLSAGLSGLTYFSLFGTIYEAGTIAAIGTVFALWRMQGDWQRATKQLEDGLFAEGRDVVVDVVDRMKVLVEQRSIVHEDSVEREARLAAEGAVVKARTELEKLELADQKQMKS